MRHPILTLLFSLVLLLTTGCGYHLRGTTQVPKELQNMLLESSDPYGPLTRAIRSQLRLSNVTIIENGARNDLPTLRILSFESLQDTVSIFQDGKTAEYQLVMTVHAQIVQPEQDVIPLNVTVFRTFFDNPLAALAKDSEQEIIRQEMREQAAQQLVRKLLTVQRIQPIRSAVSDSATADKVP